MTQTKYAINVNKEAAYALSKKGGKCSLTMTTAYGHQEYPLTNEEYGKMLAIYSHGSNIVVDQESYERKVKELKKL